MKRVGALTSTPAKERTITSKPRFGEKMPVNTPTTIHALLEFENGAVVTLNTSWDVWKHGHAPIELYGEEGTIFVPDPNFFGGTVAYTKQGDAVKKLPKWNHPLAVPNQQHAQGMLANYRTAGLADMAIAIAEGRPHRCSMERALHAVEVMTGILKSGETGKFVAHADDLRAAGGTRHRRGQGAARQKAWQEGRQKVRVERDRRRTAPISFLLGRRSMNWQPADSRYETMIYNRCGRSGLKLPAMSLGLWHNFGGDTPHQLKRAHLPQGVRPRHHPFRPRQQLRPAGRIGRGGVRRNPAAPTSPAIATS